MLANALDQATISNSHGRVTVTNANMLNVDSRHSNVEVNNAIGDIRVKTTHGNMNLSAIKGNLDLDNSHGNVTAKRIDGNVTAETSHARMTIFRKIEGAQVG